MGIADRNQDLANRIVHAQVQVQRTFISRAEDGDCKFLVPQQELRALFTHIAALYRKSGGTT